MRYAGVGGAYSAVGEAPQRPIADRRVARRAKRGGLRTSGFRPFQSSGPPTCASLATRRKQGAVSCHLWYRYGMPISSLDRDLAELAAAVRLDGTLAALAGRASIGDAYMLGMLVSGMTVYGRTTSPVDLFARINEENAKMIARGRAHGAESWSDQEIRKAIEDGDTTVTLADATVFPSGVAALRSAAASHPTCASRRLVARSDRRRRQGVVHAPVRWLARGFRRSQLETHTRPTAPRRKRRSLQQ